MALSILVRTPSKPEAEIEASQLAASGTVNRPSAPEVVVFPAQSIRAPEMLLPEASKTMPRMAALPEETFRVSSVNRLMEVSR
jgi:hypothetical protein